MTRAALAVELGSLGRARAQARSDTPDLRALTALARQPPQGLAPRRGGPRIYLGSGAFARAVRFLDCFKFNLGLFFLSFSIS